jgi:hypothetical protein
VRGDDLLSPAGIDRHVPKGLLAAIGLDTPAEEQISRGELAEGNRVADRDLLVGCARYRHADLTIGPLDQAGAIETFGR